MLKNVYETVILITPVLSDSQSQDVAMEYEKHLEGNHAQVKYRENWGLKTLAYSIEKKQSAWYYLLEYEAAPDVISELELKLRRDERVMRFLTVKFGKDALEYAERRRRKMQGKKEKQPKEKNIV